jgi:hypothetical protein
MFALRVMPVETTLKRRLCYSEVSAENHLLISHSSNPPKRSKKEKRESVAGESFYIAPYVSLII